MKKTKHDLDAAEQLLKATDLERHIRQIQMRKEVLDAAHKLLPAATEQAKKGHPNLFRLIARLATRSIRLDK